MSLNLSWAPHYTGHVLAYSWRCWRTRAVAWVATVVAIGAVLSLAANAELFLVLSQRSLASQARSASEFQVFLADNANQQQIQALEGKLQNQPGVKSIRLRSKDEALGIAKQNGGLSSIATSGSGNPFPASVVVTLSDPSAATKIAELAAEDPATDKQVPTSYTPGQAKRLSAALNWAQALVIGIGLGALAVASLVALVLIRSHVRARRSELRILSLVGTPRAVIRMPLLVESISLAIGGSVLAMAALINVGAKVVPTMNSYLPFLQLGSAGSAIPPIGLATFFGSIIALGGCSLWVRLPR